MPVHARLNAFVEARFRHQDTRSVNILNASLHAWGRYYGFLLAIRSRYEQISTRYVQASRMQFERMKSELGAGQSSPRPLTPGELVGAQRLDEIRQTLHLDIESFYVFANILLDRIASTFGYYFWRKPKWNHWQLVSNIERICAEKPLAIVAPDILTIPAELQRHVVAYRNTHIEHVEEPRLLFGTAWGPDNKAKIHPTLLYPEHGDAEALQIFTGDLDEILGLVSKYIIGMLDFFDANADKSVLPREQATSE